MFPLEKSPENKVCSPRQRGDLVPLSLSEEDLVGSAFHHQLLPAHPGRRQCSFVGQPFSCTQVTAGLQEREEAGNFRLNSNRFLHSLRH